MQDRHFYARMRERTQSAFGNLIDIRFSCQTVASNLAFLRYSLDFRLWRFDSPIQATGNRSSCFSESADQGRHERPRRSYRREREKNRLVAETEIHRKRRKTGGWDALHGLLSRTRAQSQVILNTSPHTVVNVRVGERERERCQMATVEGMKPTAASGTFL